MTPEEIDERHRLFDTIWQAPTEADRAVAEETYCSWLDARGHVEHANGLRSLHRLRRMQIQLQGAWEECEQ